MSDLRVRRRGKEWGVQERRGWFWRWIGPFGDASLGKWVNSADALAFANWCERYDLRQPAAPPAWPWQTPQAQEKRHG